MEEQSIHERREARRFPLSLSLAFERGVATTCDVSTTGAYFLTSAPPAVGERFHCTLTMQSQRLEFEAQVIRVDPCGRKFGVAARFDAVETDLTADALAAEEVKAGLTGKTGIFWGTPR